MMQCPTKESSKPSINVTPATSSNTTNATSSARFASFSAPSSIDLETSPPVTPPIVHVSPAPSDGSDSTSLHGM